MDKKSFMLVVGKDIMLTSRVRGIIQSYTLLNAQIVYSSYMPYIMDDIGTVIHIESKETIENIMHSIPLTIRYIGLVNGTEEIICPTNATGYIGIPVPPKECLIPSTMYPIQYPHITIAPPMEIRELKQYKSLLGREIEYKWGDPVQTKSVVAHPALIKGEPHHVTRGVVHGEFPKRAIVEMEGIQSDSYVKTFGFPVIM
jgi:hypothetical protein